MQVRPRNVRLMLLFGPALTIGFATCGCGGPKLGGIPVQGTVSYQGEPLIGGTVSFQPVDAERGRPALAKINPDGTYAATMLKNEPGLLPGEYRVSVLYLERPLMEMTPSNTPVRVKIPPHYNNPETSGLTLSVPIESSGVTWDIKLID